MAVLILSPLATCIHEQPEDACLRARRSLTSYCKVAEMRAAAYRMARSQSQEDAMNIRFITRLGKMPSRNVAVLALTIWAIGCGFNYAAFATEAGNDAVLTVVEKSLAERKEILKAMRDRLAELKPTENQDYDFAAFMQLYNEAMEKMAKVEAGYGADKQLKRLAKEHLRSAPKEQNQLQRWIEKFHQYD